MAVPVGVEVAVGRGVALAAGSGARVTVGWARAWTWAAGTGPDEVQAVIVTRINGVTRMVLNVVLS